MSVVRPGPDGPDDPSVIRDLGPAEPDSVRLAVKDCIDVAGVATTCGSALVAESAAPATRDAEVVARLRSAGATVVAKTNLDELCFGSTGVNPWFGTPANPLDPERIPGGSSSGAAVMVATGRADVALGTDTTGSARTPAAFCGVVGLKLTHGSVPMAGIAALAPSLDCLGILAADTDPILWALDALAAGNRDPDAPVTPDPLAGQGRPRRPRLGRIRIPGTDASIERAIDDRLDDTARRGLAAVESVELPGWDEAAVAARTILFGEAPEALEPLVGGRVDRLGPDVQHRFEMAAETSPGDVDSARKFRAEWIARLRDAMDGLDGLVTAATTTPPPLVRERSPQPNAATSPVSLAGFPAVVGPLVAPIPGGGPAPALQVIGLPGRERSICRILEAVGARTTADREAWRRRVQ